MSWSVPARRVSNNAGLDSDLRNDRALAGTKPRLAGRLKGSPDQIINAA